MSEETLFHEALAKPAAERAAFLDAACAAQPELRAAVEALLAAHEASGSLLDRPATELGQTVDSDAGPARPGGTGVDDPNAAASSCPVRTTDYHPPIEPDVVIAGRYTLVEKIGEGGMGEVWVAKQTEPVKRKVALKLIKTGMDSRAVLARFEQERQALALMDHPNIARVLDGGLTPTGQPFFVMELVNGLPLTRFCDEAKLTPRQRLELFVPICQAVQHAHQKGIVHRDLKPANILVTLIDGRPMPKVIDFGVAKATAGKLTDESMNTQFGAVVGTLEYMAPEQAGFGGEDIDTRADIYSLGVILYELLTGLRPLDATRLKKAALTEMLRIIREEEPSKPSTRLSTAGSLASLAALRQMEPKKLTALLRGELDCVVMKCLEKQRDRRYETANALNRDVQRYLADEVVEAKPPSAGYRLKKFVRRHKGQVIAASLVLLALLAGMVGTTLGLIEARRQEAEAKHQEAEAKHQEAEAKRQEGLARNEAIARELARQEEQQQRKQAQQNEAKAIEAADKEREARREEERQRQFAEAISQFVKDDFLALTSVEGQGRFGGTELTRNATLYELLDRAARKLKARKDLAPRTEAELCWIIGVSYRAVGEFAQAIPFLERSVALRRTASGAEAEATLNAQNSLAVAYCAAGQFERALTLHQQTLKLQQAKRPDDVATLEGMNNVAYTYREAGKLDLALPLFNQTLKLMEVKLSPQHPSTLRCMNNLATAYLEALKLDLALPLLEKTLKIQQKTLGPYHPDTLCTMNNLATAHVKSGRLDLALPLLEKTLKLQQKTLGLDHPVTLVTMDNLAGAYRIAWKLNQAVPLHQQTLKLMIARFGPEHPQTLLCMSNLARTYQAAGKLNLAVPLHQQTLNLQKARLGPTHPDTLLTMHNLATAYVDAGSPDLAVPLCQQTLTLRQEQFGPHHPATLLTMNNLARAYLEARQEGLALPLFEKTLNLTKTYFGPTHDQTLLCMANLATSYQKTGKLDRALPLLHQTLKTMKEKHGPDHPDTLRIMGNLAMAYWRGNERAKSIALSEETLKLQEKKLGRDHPDTLTTSANLGGSYRVVGRLKEAIALLEEAYRASKKYPVLRTYGGRLLEAYATAGEKAKLVAMLQELVAEARQVVPRGSPQLAGRLAQIGNYLLEQKLGADAEPLLRECLTIRTKTQPDIWVTFNTKSMLGGALLGQKKYADAEPLLLAGYEGMKQRVKTIPPQGKVRLTEAVDRLVQLYEATGKKEEAARWRTEREARKPQAPPK